MDKHRNSQRMIIGWREWVSLPDLGIKKIKAKIDTGARSSALHAFQIRTFMRSGKLKVTFDMHPMQKNTNRVLTCTADVIDYRWVTDSGGHREQRYVIKTTLVIGDKLSWPIEITLTNRDTMRFRMLLGRSSIHHPLLIDSNMSYLMRKA